MSTLLFAFKVDIASAAWLPAYNYGVNWSPSPMVNIDLSDGGGIASVFQNTRDYDPVQYEYVWASSVYNNIPNLYILNTVTHGGPGFQGYFYTPGRPQSDGTKEHMSCLRSDRSNPPETGLNHYHGVWNLSKKQYDPHKCNHVRYVSDLASTKLRVVLLSSCDSSLRLSDARDGLADALVRIGADCVAGFNQEITFSTAYENSPQYWYNYAFWRSLSQDDYVTQATLDAEASVYGHKGYYGGWTNNSIRGMDRRL